MRIGLTRSGGFAGITLHREIDTALLPPAERGEIEQLVARARTQTPPTHHAMPDAFEYEITIDGARYRIGDANGAWSALIDRLTTR
jgi:emfourin